MKKNAFILLLLASAMAFSQVTIVISDSVVAYEYDALMDSVRTTKKVNGYDSGGHLTNTASFNWNTGQQSWEGSFKLMYGYDLEGRYTLRIQYRWDPESDEWNPRDKKERTFNDAGQLTREISYSWDPVASDWIGTMIEEKSYNSINKMALTTFYVWNPDTEEWDIHQKVEKTYDANGHEVLLLSQIWDAENETWINHDKKETSYNPDTTLLIQEYYTWDTDLNEWHPGNRIEYTFDQAGYIIARVSIRWDDLSGEWINSSKSESTNNPDGKTILQISYQWDPGEGRWVESGKSETDYDQLGRWNYQISYTWDPGTEEWAESSRFNQYYSDEPEYMVDEFSMWNAGGESWETASRSYIYKELGTLHADSAEICRGDSIFWQGKYLSEEGLYDTVYVYETEMSDIHSMKLIVHPEPGNFGITGNSTPVSNEILTYTVPEDASLTYAWHAENADILSYPENNSAELQWGADGSGLVRSVAENQYGCLSDTALLEVTISPSLVEETGTGRIAIYPNPATDHITIRMDEVNLPEGCMLQIMSPSGKVILETLIDQTGQRVKLPEGTGNQMLLFRLTGPGGELITTRKIVVH